METDNFTIVEENAFPIMTNIFPKFSEFIQQIEKDIEENKKNPIGHPVQFSIYESSIFILQRSREIKLVNLLIDKKIDSLSVQWDMSSKDIKIMIEQFEKRHQSIKYMPCFIKQEWQFLQSVTTPKTKLTITRQSHIIEKQVKEMIQPIYDVIQKDIRILNEYIVSLKNVIFENTFAYKNKQQVDLIKEITLDMIEQSVAQPVAAQPVAERPALQFGSTWPVAAQPVAAQPVAAQPVAERPAFGFQSPTNTIPVLSGLIGGSSERTFGAPPLSTHVTKGAFGGNQK